MAGRRARAGIERDALRAFATDIFIGLLAGFAFGKAGILPPIASAWLGNIVFGIIGIYLINKRA